MAKKATRYDSDPGLVLASWRNQTGKRLIVSRNNGYGRKVHIRLWLRNDKGAYYPTRKGVTVGAAELKKLRGAVRKAIEMCEND